MLYCTIFKYAGFEIETGQNEAKEYFLTEKSMEKFFSQSNEKSTFRVREIFESKSLKAFTSEDLKSAKISSKSNLHPQPQTAWYPISTFLTLVAWQVNEGNQTAINFAVTGMTIDFLTSLKSHYGVVMTEDEKEYQRALVFNRLQAFKSWTDIIKERHMKFYGVAPSGDYYADKVRKVNLALFGVPHFKCDRNNMNQEQQELITEFERNLVSKAKRKPDWHVDAIINSVLDFMN